MTEARAILLIVAAATVLEAALILGMAAAGVRGPVLGLGAIVPLVLAAYASSSMVGRYGTRNRAGR
jgi:hypothetical protein